MKRRRSLYPRPAIVRGEQCAEAPLGAGGATTEELLGSARGSLGLGGGLMPSLHGLPSAAGAVHRNTVGRPSAVTRLVSLGGPDAGGAVVTLSRPRPASSVQCPVRASSVHVTDVRCPVRASAVRAFPRPRCPTGMRSWSAAVGRRRHGWDGQGRFGCLPCPRPARRLPKAEPGARSWRRPVLGQRRRWLGIVVGGGCAVAWSTVWPTGEAGCARGSPRLKGAKRRLGSDWRWRLRSVVTV